MTLALRAALIWNDEVMNDLVFSDPKLVTIEARFESAATRLLIAEATIDSRSAARAMFRSSQTATNMRSVTGSK